VHTFINQDDHGVQWSYGECVDILMWLQKLRDGSIPTELGDDWGEPMQWLQKLQDVFAEAVEKKIGAKLN
jgi:hypothetical protein